jgi:hypothetical protein
MESQVVFRGSLKKALMVLLISVGFVVLGAWATTERPVIGWLCIAFFGLGIPASLLMMRPNSTYLKLDADGIDIVNMWRHFKLKWSEVAKGPERADTGLIELGIAIGTVFIAYYGYASLRFFRFVRTWEMS